ncbi:hypothetical protein [Streptomyces sp. JHA26]|uniref:hypothetical protein n=1 Tax=Streptomyces sp. JHA26 TaxID=1917143 RepID=UPI00098AD76B|nr:hypothetical protein [Streptomyces sp. JHA26]
MVALGGALLGLLFRGGSAPSALPRVPRLAHRKKEEAARALGRNPVARHGEPMASTDMGNVSHVVPSIHPCIGYDTGGALQHTEDFARHGTGADADRAVLDGAIALARVAVDLATDPVQRDRFLHGVARRRTAASPG